MTTGLTYVVRSLLIVLSQFHYGRSVSVFGNGYGNDLHKLQLFIIRRSIAHLHWLRWSARPG